MKYAAAPLLFGCALLLTSCRDNRDVTTALIHGQLAFDARNDHEGFWAPWWPPMCPKGFSVFGPDGPVWTIENTDEKLCSRASTFPITYGQTPAHFRVLVPPKQPDPSVLYYFGGNGFGAGRYYGGGFVLSPSGRIAMSYRANDPMVQAAIARASGGHEGGRSE